MFFSSRRIYSSCLPKWPLRPLPSRKCWKADFSKVCGCCRCCTGRNSGMSSFQDSVFIGLFFSWVSVAFCYKLPANADKETEIPCFLWQGGFSSLVKSLRTQCIELLTEIEARLDFDDEMPPIDLNLIMTKIHAMSQDVENALETANYDKLLQSGLQV